jgi:hypothetical protein
MKVSYEFARDDLAAFIEYHQRTSPAARNQKLGCFIVALAGLLVLPVGIVATTDEPILETAMKIWPLFLGPFLFAILALPYIKWRTRQMSIRLLNEGANRGFYGRCELNVDSEGVKETRPGGSTFRNWSSVERIAITRDYLFVYTSGIEAFVVPRRAFSTDTEFKNFTDAIAKHSGVSADAS